MTGVEIGAIAAAVGTAIVNALPGIIISAVLNLVVSLLIGAPSSSSSTTINGQRMSDAAAPVAGYGVSIPIVYGTTRQTTTLIWQREIQESKRTEVSTTSSGGGKSGKITSTQTINTFLYHASFAVLACEGPIVSFDTIKANGKLLSPEFRAEYITEYLGTSDQPVNEYMRARTSQNVPAYTNRAYLVFELVPLEDFGNRIPEISVQITSAKNTVKEVIDDLISRSEIPTHTVSSEIENSVITGGSINEVSSIRSGLAIFSAAYNFIVTESDGIIKFIRGRAG